MITLEATPLMSPLSAIERKIANKVLDVLCGQRQPAVGQHLHQRQQPGMMMHMMGPQLQGQLGFRQDHQDWMDNSMAGKIGAANLAFIQ